VGQGLSLHADDLAAFHSAEAIEREKLAHLIRQARAKILVLNAAKMFKFDIESLLARPAKLASPRTVNVTSITFTNRGRDR